MDDVTPAVLEAYAKKETDFESTFTRQLTRYDTIKPAIETNITRQTTTLSVVKQANDQFKRLQNSNDTIKQREAALQNLETGYNLFKELSSNFKEGIKFYSDLRVVVNKLKRQVDDFCQARNSSVRI